MDDGEIFREWLVKFNEHIANTKNKTVLLIIDNELFIMQHTHNHYHM